MPDHSHDESNAPDQGDSEKPTDPSAHLAVGIPGSEPPLETEGATMGHRHATAAGFTAIFETTKFGVREMGVTRSFQTLLKINQKDGFDCPSCAWPDPDGDRHVAEFCENGAKATASEATRKRLTPEIFAKYSIPDLLNKPDVFFEQELGRITHPMVRRKGSDRYEPIEWDEAFALVGRELRALPSADAAAFYTSGRASNEAAFLYGTFARQFGTNNLPDCSNMCHESSGTGLSETIGAGKATVKLEDFDHAQAIFVIGQNPGTCHPRMLTELQKAARNGCKIVSVNPLIEPGLRKFKNPQEAIHMLGTGTDLACLFLTVKINGDVALLKGIMKEMLEEDRRTGKVLARDFIEQHTEGFEAFAHDIEAESWDAILESSGVPRENIREAAQIAMSVDRMICSWAMGITQHKNGVDNVRSIVNFALLRGNIGKRGAGVCPVRGHSNVQGDRSVGIWEKMSPEFLDALGKEFQFSPPRKHGHDAVRSIEAMHNGEVKVFVGLGGNFLQATPDTKYTSEALAQCKLTVQISTKLNRSHLITGEQALILPCLGRTEKDVQNSGEQFVSVEDTTSVVHMSRGRLEPASEFLKSEVAIIAGIAMATLGDESTVAWSALVDNYDLIRQHIEHVVPGFTQYNARVRQPGGFYLPNEPYQGKFPTKSKKAQFSVCKIPVWKLAPGQLLLTTLRSHDQFNTTIYSENDRYRGIKDGRRVIFLNKDDIARRNLQAGAWVDLVSHYQGETRRAARFKIVEYDIPRGCAAAYYPETNVLVAVRDVADGSNQPASKSVVITLEAASAK